ncbi:MAG: serine O-acetyltransferase [Acidobacteria bacterium]|jgi:serine O-acetyltransferase|nr:serine O-acetyltransferase [Acidobacteriota bacterium]
MFDNLAADTRRLREIKTRAFPWYVLESLLFETGYQAVVLHRLAHWFKARGIPFFGPALARWNQFLTGVDIAPAARIGPGLRIAHGTGIVIGNGVRIGSDCLLMQNVTLGAPTSARIEEMPSIGDRVTLGAGCAVIGRVSVGDDCFVGAHALVTQDVPAGARVLAPRSELR